MDVPSEALWILLTLISLGIVIALIAFFAFQSGTFRGLDALLGFFR